MQRIASLVLLVFLVACADNRANESRAVSEPEPKYLNTPRSIDLGATSANLPESDQVSFGAGGLPQQRNTQPFPLSAYLTAQDANSRINLRSQPSSQSPDQGYGLVGDPVQVLDQAQGDDGFSWYLVRFNGSGAEGWIRNDFFEIVDSTNPGHISIREKVAAAALLTSQHVEDLIALDLFSRNEYDGTTEGVEEAAKWNGIPYGIIMPTYIPSGFRLSGFSVSSFHGTDGPGGYRLEYSNNLGQCFSLSTETGGLGAGAEDYQSVEVYSPALGTVKVGYTEFSQYSSAPETILWVSQGKISYMFTSPAGDCEQTVSFAEAAKIVESLNYLNLIPRGYPQTKQWEPL